MVSGSLCLTSFIHVEYHVKRKGATEAVLSASGGTGRVSEGAARISKGAGRVLEGSV